MRIMTWNIQWGRGMDGRVDLGRIAEIVRANDPDIICFQEVASGFGDLAGNDDADQFAALARLFPRHEAHAGIALDVRSSSGTRKTFGNLLLSRLPVASVRRHALPWSTVEGRECMPRGLIEAVIETPGGPLRVMTTHLEYSSPDLRTPQIEAMRAIHAEATRRVAQPPRAGHGTYTPQSNGRSAILTADFNMQPDSANYRRLLEPFADGAAAFVDSWRHLNGDRPHPPTFCVDDPKDARPPHCLDFVFVTDDLAPRLQAMRYDIETRASDHQPAIVDIA